MSSIRLTTEQHEYLLQSIADIVQRVNFDATRHEVGDLIDEFFSYEDSHHLAEYFEPIREVIMKRLHSLEDVFDEHANIVQDAIEQRDAAIRDSVEKDRAYHNLLVQYDFLRIQLADALSDEIDISFEDAGD